MAAGQVEVHAKFVRAKSRNVANYFDPPLERIMIPFDGKELVGYLRKPKGIARYLPVRS